MRILILRTYPFVLVQPDNCKSQAKKIKVGILKFLVDRMRKRYAFGKIFVHFL